jgi:hypothetical protein
VFQNPKAELGAPGKDIEEKDGRLRFMVPTHSTMKLWNG